MACAPSFDPYVLTQLDHTIPPFHVSGFLTFHIREPNNAIPALEAAVARLVVLLPFLSGNVTSSSRLAGKKNVLEVQPPSEDFLSQHPMLVVKNHDLSIIPGGSSSTVSYDDISNDNFLPIPLEFTGVDRVWRFQANVMLDGIILSFTINHQAFDGVGALNIIRAFATCCRNPNADVDSLPTNFEKESNIRKKISDAAHASATGAPDYYHSTEVASRPVDISTLNERAQDPVSRKLILDGGKVQRLRNACSVEGHPKDQGTLLSGNTIVTAILWICLIRARFGSQAEGSQPPAVSSAAMISDLRSKLRPKLPMSYLGNAIGSAWTSIPVEQVLSSTPHVNCDSRTVARMNPHYIKIVANAAKQLQNAVQTISDGYVRNMISEKNAADNWESQPIMADMHVSSLRQLNVYALDFGPTLGRLSNFDMPENRFPGLAWILPAHGKSQSSPWEVRLTLEPETMEKIEKDPLLRWCSSGTLSKL